MSKMDRELDEKLEKGTHASCIRANVKLDPEGKLNESELTSLNVTMTAAGLDTMQSTVSWGIAILSMKPDIQEKALKEIRKKYPEDQPLCDASDDQTIEYISVLAKEISRLVHSGMPGDIVLVNLRTDVTQQLGSLFLGSPCKTSLTRVK